MSMSSKTTPFNLELFSFSLLGSLKSNSASGRSRHLGVIVLTILQTGMK